MLFILAILVAKGAFRDYETIEELLNLVPPGEEMYLLQWDEKELRQPFFESVSGTGEIENATAYSGHFRDLGFRTGFAWPGTIHDFRALGLYLIHHQYVQVSMEKFAGQKSSNVFRDHYLPNLTGDGQGSYFGTGTRSLFNDLFLSLTLLRNPQLAQELPVRKATNTGIDRPAKEPKLADDNAITDALPTNGASKEPATDDSLSETAAKTSANPKSPH